MRIVHYAGGRCNLLCSEPFPVPAHFHIGKLVMETGGTDEVTLAMSVF